MWIANIKDWIGLSFAGSRRAVKDRTKGRETMSVIMKDHRAIGTAGQQMNIKRSDIQLTNKYVIEDNVLFFSV